MSLHTHLRRRGAGIAPLVGVALLFGALAGARPVHAACPCSLWPDPVTPGFSYANPAPVEAGLKFRSDIAGNVTGVRFFKMAGASGTHLGRLWTTGGVKLAEVAFSGETDTGWQTASFATPVAIQPNITYIVSYTALDGNHQFSDTFDFFATTGVDNGPLHALAEGVDGSNGVYGESGAFMTQSYRSSNYWVDVVFSDVAGPPDVTPPTLSSTVPASGSTGVLIGSSITATFDEALDPATVTGATITLRDPSNVLVPATVAYNSGTFTATLTPSASLVYNTTYTATVTGGGSGVKDLAGNALVADASWSFTTEAPDVTPPTVTSVMPIAGVTRLRPATRVTVHFSEAMDPASVTSASFELRDASNALVASSVSYDGGTQTATLTPNAPLARATTYTARVKGGAGGVRDAFANAMAADYTWSFGTAPIRPPVDQAPGGPILIVSASGNLYTRYLTEIVRTEGFNEFDLADLSQVTSGMLAAHDVVLLGDMPLSAAQVTMLSDWVTAGGHLIAMHPDKQLASLLGLTDAATTLSDRYLMIDTSKDPGVGIVGQTLQFHGSADAYTLSGATALATLYSDLSTATAYPAVTMRAVGANGGVACAFTFDLARSIVWTHQGNPAWQQGHVNPLQTYGTALDLFYPDWIDFSRISIPQADEQQRFLANLILSTNASRKPLPRFWYLPKGKKAAIVLTGDDHWGISTPSGNTKIFFDKHIAQSPHGCSVDDWECVRSSSYGFDGNLMTDAEAAAYTAEGFEFGLHADGGLASNSGWCGEWPTDMPEKWDEQLEPLMLKYASIPAPTSERSHCYTWFGYTGAPGWLSYAGTPEVEVDRDTHFDTNISYNPAEWATVNPGYQMGSGMMMRFAEVDPSGVMTKYLDIYNAGTQMNDDNGQGAAAMRTIVDSFLDAAKGPQGYYGGFVVNMHSDNWYGWSYDGSDQIVASAQAHDIPVVSGRQMSDWLDGRNASSFGSIAWDGTTLGFTVAVGTGARNLMGMIPSMQGLVPLTQLRLDGGPVAYTIETIKGRSYAMFPAAAGTYAATYTPDVTPPVITALTVSATGGTSASVHWTTDEPATSRVDLGTTTGSLTPGATDASLVTAHSVSLSGLTPTTTYYLRVVSLDSSNNSATSPNPPAAPASFATPAATLADITVADFTLGSPDANTAITETADGEVTLAPAVGAEFSGSSLPPGWSSSGGTALVSGGTLTLNGSTTGPTASFGPGRSVEASATFTPAPFEHIGFGVNLTAVAGDAWAIISTGSTGTGLFARTWTGSGAFDTQSTPIPGSWFGARHRYRVDWNANSIEYYIDGVLVVTHNLSLAGPMRPLLSVGSTGVNSLVVDWLHMTPYASPGVFTSRVFDAGAPATWQGLSWTADVVGSTALAMSVRTGNTPAPDGSWSAFNGVASSGGAIGGSTRYVQYQAALSSSDPTLTPVLRDVTIAYTAQLQSHVEAQVPVGASISNATACVTVPVVYTRVENGPARASSVMLHLSPELKLCDALHPNNSVHQGNWLQGYNSLLTVVDRGGGDYEIDQAILGTPCGMTGGGTLFTVDVTNAGADGNGTLAVTSVSTRDCSNAPIPVAPGSTPTLVVDRTPPTAVNDLVVTPTATAGASAGTRKLALAFTTPGDASSVEVYRAPFGGYPLYDHAPGTGHVPVAPTAYPPVAPWTLVSGLTAAGSDDPGTRDFWYYVVVTRDPHGNSAFSTRSAGTLDYILGDTHNGQPSGDCVGDGQVTLSDISFLGAHYGLPVTADPSVDCLDVGPTTDYLVTSRPTPDGLLDFEDLAVFALDYGAMTTAAPPARAHVVASPATLTGSTSALGLFVPRLPGIGEHLDVGLDFEGAGEVHALSVELAWDPAVVQAETAHDGDLLGQQTSDHVTLSTHPGDLDIALLGAAGGITGRGTLAAFGFRVVGSGDPKFTLARIKARDAKNHDTALSSQLSARVRPTTTELSRAMPNPFGDQTTFEFALADPGDATLAIYGIDGRRIRTLVAGGFDPGVYRMAWDGRDDDGHMTAAGVYFVRLTTHGINRVRTVVRIR